jgi:outer membrane receptor protein involved in Fe transport
MRSLLCSLLVLTLAIHAAAVDAQAARYSGRTLQSVLDELRAAGAPLAYSSNLVPRRLRVESEPSATEQLALVRELLAPHGLAIQETGNSWLVVRGSAAAAPQALGGIALAVVAAGVATPISEAVAQVDAPNGPTLALVAGRAVFRDVAPGRHELTVRAPGFLPERAPVEVRAGATADLELELVAAAPPLEELTVTASRYDLHNELRPSASYFSQEQIENLAELGDDALRAAHRLPGIATNEFSSRSHVRGGAADEMTVILDGMKLFEPFHLRDYQSVFSAIDQRIVSGIEVYSGGFPVAYGDALSGLTVIDQLEPTERLRHELGVSLLYTSVLSSGTFDEGRDQWLVSVRRGNIDQLLQEGLGEPSYRDAFVHVGVTLSAKHRLALNDIGFDDDIVFTPEDAPGNLERARSDTDNNQAWLKVDSDWTSKLSSRSLVYATDFSAERQGSVTDVDNIVGTADDLRELDAHGIKQDWRWDASGRQLLSWGFDAEQLDGRYRYASTVDLRGVLATLESQPTRSRAHALTVLGESYSAYAADRIRLSDRAIADLGIRWDKQTYLPPGDDEQFSPRGSVLYRLGGRTDLRMSYGRFFQSESLIDLQVEDGVLGFAPAQNASHSIAGIEHRFANELALRVEIFRKWTREARPRYENLFDPLVLLPELRPGRVRIEPDRAESRGLEVLVSGNRAVEWWAGYSFARAEDIVDGERVARSWDQRHALSGGATWDAGPWTLTGVASLHSGWPATTVELQPSSASNAVDGFIAVAGPRNGDRLRAVRRIDFRASRMFDAGPGTLRFFAELTNVTNRTNPCCVRYEPVMPTGGELRLDRIERRALPFTGNVGVLWQF